MNRFNGSLISFQEFMSIMHEEYPALLPFFDRDIAPFINEYKALPSFYVYDTYGGLSMIRMYANDEGRFIFSIGYYPRFNKWVIFLVNNPNQARGINLEVQMYNYGLGI